MRNIFRYKSEFSRNVVTLMTGTMVAQAIPIAISPILTRIYTPEDFGLFALYMSMVGILSILVTGRYELAIILPKEDRDAINIVMLCLVITFIISLISLLIVLIFNAEISSLFENNEISNWLYFIPFTLMFSGIYQSLYVWNNRMKNYKNISKSTIFRSSITGSTNLTVGPIIPGALGLVLGNILGLISSTFYLAYKSYLNDKGKFITEVQYTKLIEVAKRYKKFPQYDALASFLNITSHQSTYIFFNVFFGATSSGYFYLTQKIFGLPIQLFALSIQSVFREKIIVLHNGNGNTRKFYIETFYTLFLMALLPTVLIYYFAVDAFVFFFGEPWQPAGEFVQILIPVFFLRFISFPLSFMIYIVEKQHIHIIGQAILLLLTIMSFLIGKQYDAKVTVGLLSISLSVYYLAYLYISFKFTSRGDIDI